MLRLPSIPFPSLPFPSFPFPSLLFSSLPFPSLPLLSLPFHTSHCGFRIPDTGFQFLSVKLGFCISIVSGIPDSLGCIPDSKAQDFWFLQLYSEFQSAGFRIPTAVLRIPTPRIPDCYSCTPDSKAQDSGFLQLYSGFQRPGFRIVTAVLRIPKRRIPDSYSCTPDSNARDSGFLQLYSGFQSAGFRIPIAVLRIPKRRIPDSTSTKFPRFQNPDSLTWAVTRFEWYDFCDRCAESLHMLWFNFILGLDFIFLCFKLTTPEQRKRIKLNHNIYIPRIVSGMENIFNYSTIL